MDRIETTFDDRPLRVMFCGKSMSRSRTTGALVDGLRANGCEVSWHNFAALRRWRGASRAIERLRRDFDRQRPDLVFVFCMDLPRLLLAEFAQHATIVQWVEELGLVGPEEQLEYMRSADLVCLSNPKHLETMSSHGLHNGCHVMSGFSPRFHYPLRGQSKRYDVTFIGGPGADGGRGELMMRLAESHRVHVFGRGWDSLRRAHPNLHAHGPVGAPGFRRVCSRSRIVLGMSQLGGAPGYFSNRIWMTLGCGAFHLTEWVPGIEDVFERGRHLEWFRDAAEAATLITRYLADDAARAAVATQGLELALQKHQCRHRIATVLEQLRADAPRVASARATPA